MTSASGNFCYKGYRVCGRSFANNFVKRGGVFTQEGYSRAYSTIPVVFAFKRKGRREKMLNIAASVFLQLIRDGLDVHIDEKTLFIGDITRHVIVTTRI